MVKHRDAKRRGIYLPLFTDPEGDSRFCIYQINWIKMKKKKKKKSKTCSPGYAGNGTSCTGKSSCLMHAKLS